MLKEPKQVDDQLLIAQLRDPVTRARAFPLLVDRYGEQLYHHIRRLLISAEDSRDVLQNTLLSSWRGLDGFRADSRLYTWLYRIATNEALAWLDRQRRRPQLLPGDEQQWLSEQLRAEHHFEGADIQRRLLLALAGLPPKQRLIFSLRYFDEVSYRELSDMLGTSEGSLKASFHHAARKVEEHLRHGAEDSR